jgi:hypothetical protein
MRRPRAHPQKLTELKTSRTRLVKISLPDDEGLSRIPESFVDLEDILLP